METIKHPNAKLVQAVLRQLKDEVDQLDFGLPTDKQHASVKTRKGMIRGTR